jgi:hypothetical protein
VRSRLREAPDTHRLSARCERPSSTSSLIGCSFMPTATSTSSKDLSNDEFAAVEKRASAMPDIIHIERWGGGARLTRIGHDVVNENASSS